MNHFVEFPAGSATGSTRCFNITILSDNIFEKSHSFTVDILSPVGNVSVSSPMYASVTILDNEG